MPSSILVAFMLSGLVASDSGPLSRPPSVDPAISFKDSWWIGTWQGDGYDHDVGLWQGRLSYSKGKLCNSTRFRITVEGPDKVRASFYGEVHYGIYRVRGDKVEVCWGAEPGWRPTSFRACEGSWLWVLHPVPPL